MQKRVDARQPAATVSPMSKPTCQKTTERHFCSCLVELKPKEPQILQARSGRYHPKCFWATVAHLAQAWSITEDAVLRKMEGA